MRNSARIGEMSTDSLPPRIPPALSDCYDNLFRIAQGLSEIVSGQDPEGSNGTSLPGRSENRHKTSDFRFRSHRDSELPSLPARSQCAWKQHVPKRGVSVTPDQEKRRSLKLLGMVDAR